MSATTVVSTSGRSGPARSAAYGRDRALGRDGRKSRDRLWGILGKYRPTSHAHMPLRHASARCTARCRAL